MTTVLSTEDTEKVWSPFAEHLEGLKRSKKVLKENGGYVGGCQPQRSFLQSAEADELRLHYLQVSGVLLLPSPGCSQQCWACCPS